MIHPKIYDYLNQRGYSLLDFQKKVIETFQNSDHGLIKAPTGRGKTLALFFAICNDLLISKPKKIIWVTPMRALVSDTYQQLERAKASIAPSLKIMQRTSDTTAYQKSKIKKTDWDILITTPESCSILGSQKEMIPQLKSIDLIVIDEFHCLIGNKRGQLFELFLAWLATLNTQHRRWALSATISNTPIAKKILAPNQNVAIIEDTITKKITASVLFPSQKKENLIKQLGTGLINEVIDEICAVRSTILFTNTRSQSENWLFLLASSGKFKKHELAIHHSAIDAKIRKKAESDIKSGAVRCIIATASLDLGVDLEPVDKVLHLGSPKGFARLKQRAGRSGHSPFSTSNIVLIPRNSFEILEGLAVIKYINDPIIEDDPILTKPFDICMQHCITMGLVQQFCCETIYNICQNTVSFSTITKKEIDWILKFCCNEHSILKAYPEHSKLIESNGFYTTTKNQQIKTLHKLNIGTITSEESLTLMQKNRKKLGTIEETFIRQLLPNDTFLFGGTVLKIEKIYNKEVIVKKAKSKIPKYTRWLGGTMSMTTQLAESLLKIFEAFKENTLSCDQNFKDILSWQKKVSHIPSKNECLIETTTIDDGTALFIYTFFGRKNNHALGLSLNYILSKKLSCLIGSSINDYGIMLQCDRNVNISQLNWQEILHIDTIKLNCEKGFNANEMILQEFRQICMIAGLINKGLPGKPKNPNHTYATTKILYDVFKNYDQHNLFLQQAQELIFTHDIFPTHLQDRLKIINQSIVIKKLKTWSPFSLSLCNEQLISKIEQPSWT